MPHQRRLAVFAVRHRDLDVVRAPQPVGDDHVAAGGHAVEAVQFRVGQVVDGILAAAGIQRVAVGQKGPAAQLADQIRHGFYVVRPKEGIVSQLAEVHLDGHELVLQVDAADVGGPAQLSQFYTLADAGEGTEIREKYLRFFHGEGASLSGLVSDAQSSGAAGRPLRA